MPFTLKRENCDKVGIYVINTSAHDITLKGRTEIGFLQPVRSVTPVELKFKDHNEMDKERNPKELKATRDVQYRTSQRQLEADEKLETDVVPKVTLGNHLSEDQTECTVDAY